MTKLLTHHLPKLLFAAVFVAAFILYCRAQRGSGPSGVTAGEKSAFRDVLKMDTTPIKREGALLKSYADVIDRVEQAVVKISTAQEFILRRRANPYYDDPFLRRFFGIEDEPRRAQAQRVRRPLGLGSGVIVTKDGYILTNNHVIAEATEIKVSIPGRQGELDAEVVATDPEHDVAVIKVKAGDLPVATLADSSQVRRGDVVFAVGSPLGYEQSVTMGIVSAVGRRGVESVGEGKESLIQTDAAINPGNSGGPLIDADGRVIGINTAIASNTGTSIDIGFAIPINRVVQIASSMVTPGKMGQRGYLGVNTEPLTPEMAKLLSLPEVSGAYVKELPSGSPAAQAGIKVDDVIVEFQGRRMDGPQQLNDEVAALPPGREVSLQVWRDGTKREIKVKLGDYAQVLAARSSELAQKDSGEPGGLKHPYGLKLVELNDTHRRNLGLSRNSQGLVIEEVEKNSSAALNGLQPGDLVLRINRQDVSTLEEATAALQRSGEDGSSIFNVWRQGRIGVFVLKKN